MATRGIDELVWAGFTDPVFREWLLDGHRREVLDTLDLTETERQAVLAVEADTLEALAAALCRAPSACGIATTGNGGRGCEHAPCGSACPTTGLAARARVCATGRDGISMKA